MIDTLAFFGGLLCGGFGVYFAIEREWQMTILCGMLFTYMEAMLIMFA